MKVSDDSPSSSCVPRTWAWGWGERGGREQHKKQKQKQKKKKKNNSRIINNNNNNKINIIINNSRNNNKNNSNNKTQIYYFYFQLLLNTLWSYFFFYLRNPFYGFLGIVALWFSIIAMIISFYKTSKISSYLLAPYLFWVSFAGILNLTIWKMN